MISPATGTGEGLDVKRIEVDPTEVLEEVVVPVTYGERRGEAFGGLSIVLAMLKEILAEPKVNIAPLLIPEPVTTLPATVTTWVVELYELTTEPAAMFVPLMIIPAVGIIAGSAFKVIAVAPLP